MNPNITSQYFLSLFDEFSRVKKSKLDAYIGIASGRVPCEVWTRNTKYATALLTAHMLATSGPQGGGPTGGALTQEQVGDLSRTYATMFTPGAGDAPFMSTRYGIDFIALRRETIVSGMTTRGPSFGRRGRVW
jgi:hypothetical protein